MLSNHITIHECFEPELRNFLFSEVIVFGLLFLLSEEFSNLLEISVSECVFSHNDVVNFLDERLVLFSELAFATFLLGLKFFIKLSFLD